MIFNNHNFKMKEFGRDLGAGLPEHLDFTKSGLVAWYEGLTFLNSPATPYWFDLSNNGRHATPRDFARTTSSGADGKGAVVYDGSNDLMETTTSFTNMQAYTKEMMVFVEYPGSHSWGRLTNFSNHGDLMMALGYNQIEMIVNFTTTHGRWRIDIPLNQWFHIVAGVNRSSTSCEVEAYVNGKPAGITKTVTPAGSAQTGGGYLKLGNVANQDRQLKGKIKTFRMYNRVLSEAEAIANYKACTALF